MFVRFYFIIILQCFVLWNFAQHTPRPNIIGPNDVEVNIRTGNVFHPRTDLSIPGRGISTDITFSYNTSLDTLDFGYGRGWTFTYNMQYDTFLTSVILLRPDGRQDTFLLDGNTYQSPVGVYDQLEEYIAGKFSLRTKYGMKYFFEDNNHKKLTKIEDPNGNSLILTYDNGSLSSLTNPSGRSLNFIFSDEHLTQIIDSSSTSNRVLSYQYDAAGNMTCATDPLGNQQCYEYGDFNNIVSISNKRGVPVSIEYDSGLRVKRIVSCLGEQHITYLENKIFLVEKGGGETRTTQYVMDEIGRLINLKNPSGNNISFAYNEDNNLISFTDFNGQSQLFTYDSLGNVLTATDPLGNVTTYAYEAIYNKIASMTDRRGNTTSFSYDSNANLISVSTPLGITNNYGYDNNGDLLFIVDSSGDTVHYMYDAIGNLTDIQYPIGFVSFEYNSTGDLVQMTNTNNDAISFGYDELGQLIHVSNYQNDSTHYTYDEIGNLTTEIDANGIQKGYVYDAHGRLISVSIPAGITNYEYDFWGNITKVINANGQVVSYDYNSQNLVSSVTDAMGNKKSFLYDSNGNLVETIQPNGKDITYTYDALNRLLSQSYEENTDNYGYDNEGNLINALNNEIVYNFTYDQLNRLTSKSIVNWGKMISYTYNNAGDRLTMTDPNMGLTVYGYDDNHRLISIINPSNDTTIFTYDLEGRLTQQDNHNGTFSTYNYDAQGNLLQVTNLKSTNDTISFFAYTYDDVGNRLSMADNDGTNYYFYDNNYRVDSIVYSNGEFETFIYDDVGNRINWNKNGVLVPYSYNNSDMMILGGDSNFNFDQNGNMISRTDTLGTTYYEYDAQNRLHRVILSNGQSCNFKYDPLGNRICKLDTSGFETRFVNDFDNILMEFDSEDNLKTRYTSGLNVDSWILMEKNNQVYLYHKDGLNSTTEITTELQNEVNSYKYDAFGNIIYHNEGVINNIKYTGREYNPITSLYYYRSRYYDSKIGRFLVRDNFSGFLEEPLSLNRYNFNFSNPINLIDPYGEYPVVWLIVGIGVVGGYGLYNFHKDMKNNVEEPRKRTEELRDRRDLVDLYNIGTREGYEKYMNTRREYAKSFLQTGEEAVKAGSRLKSPTNLFDIAEGSVQIIFDFFGTLKNLFNNDTDAYQNFLDELEVTGNQNSIESSQTFLTTFFIPTNRAIDPNDITGPTGFDHPSPDTLRWVSVNDRLGYLVRFENDPDFATAPAQRVHITVPVDSHLNILSFRLADFGFGDFQFHVPPNTSFYTERLDVVDSLGLFVDVTAGIDLSKNEMFWIFQSIDPATGLPPEDPLSGFLPVNDTLQIDSLTQQGEGFANFSIVPNETALTLDTAFAQASIVFDDNEPVLTNTWSNVIDAFAPTSTLNELPEYADSTSFQVSWSVVDDANGVGVSHVDVYARQDSDAFYLYQSIVDTNFVWFTGIAGATYYFYTRGTDLVGNEEAQKLVPEDTITVVNDLKVLAKVFLEGPYEEQDNMMSDQLRSLDHLPLTEPFTAIGFTHHNNGGGEATTQEVLAITGTNAITDWIFLELRNKNNSTEVLATRSALVQRDGDIVDLDGVSPVQFFDISPDDYFIAIRHRNHLGIRTNMTTPLSSTIGDTIDFTDPTLSTYGINARKVVNEIAILYAGNANQDSQINAVDKNAYWRPQNGQAYDYLTFTADFNLDGAVNAVDKNNYWRVNNSLTEQLD